MVGCLFKGEIAVGTDELIPFINQSMNSDTLGKVLDTLKLLQLAVPKLEGFLETELPDGSGRTYKDRILPSALFPASATRRVFGRLYPMNTIMTQKP